MFLASLTSHKAQIILCVHFYSPTTIPVLLAPNTLLRSGTSPGANYEEARGAQSRADFIHKMSVTLKELKESRYWLTLIRRSKMTNSNRIESVIDECEQLCAIIAKGIITARSRK
ncbi:MAG: four helix bundle protein [Candidatus Aminicenantes bacterium]|nr:four helix bundle protein [Candidatus Aminicenantes bacterium]